MVKGIKPITILITLLVVATVYLIYKSVVEKQSHTAPLKVSIPEAKARRFGLIIDVRTPKERELLGYYPNSIPISLERLSKEVPLDISSKNTWILVYSNGDNRAFAAANKLYTMGYPNVRYITDTYLSLMPGSK